jgi:site-specific DNA-methyltransferase (adenine-specific)
MNKELMFSSKNHEWETPDDLFKMLDMEFNFKLDLAANKHNTKCKRFISEDSLSKDWLFSRDDIALETSTGYKYNLRENGYMWLNPPYGKSIKDWIKKCDEEAQKGAKIVALLPARTDTLWFHNHIYRKYEIRFLKGRLKFKLNGEEQDAAPFPSMIVIFEKKEDGYTKEFKSDIHSANPETRGELINGKF